MSINVKGFNKVQSAIADLLWKCETTQQVDAVILLFGTDAVIVRDMIIAAQLDEVVETRLAGRVLDQFRI
jgi:hypothetical protein